MKTIRDTAVATGVALGVTLSLMVSVTLTVLFVAGSRTEEEKTDTAFSIKSALEFERHADRRVREGDAPRPPEANRAGDSSGESPRATAPSDHEDAAPAPYVGGNYVSSRSTMRYVIDDSGGRISMYGYDVMRGRRVFVGAGKMVGRRLVIPDFYSFLDDTRGTLKLELTNDGRAFEGVFEGMNAAQHGPVTLIRLP